MDKNVSPTNNPHLERVLTTYKKTAYRSLCGPPQTTITDSSSPIDLSSRASLQLIASQRTTPAAVMGSSSKKSFKEGGLNSSTTTTTTVGPIFPVFTPMDTTHVERTATVLEGETIACFVIGGEERLCLPQILNTVLQDFSLQDINAVCDDLHVFCTRCSDEQLLTLKSSSVLPAGAPSCGLITKTDAQRLCSALLHSSCEGGECERPPRSVHSIRVYHYCFGKGDGHLNPDLYTFPEARCIHCAQCKRWFTPAKFVCHSHRAPENRTCHWGFDSERWRDYLLVKDEKSKDALEAVKSRFDPKQKHKRRQIVDGEGHKQKRVKTEASLVQDVIAWCEAASKLGRDNSVTVSSSSDPQTTPLKKGKLLAQLIRDGIPSSLQNDPPVLLNPDRVVPFSESQRYERHFTPNVSLVPSSKHKHSIVDDGRDQQTQDVSVKAKLIKDSVSEICGALVKNCGENQQSQDVGGTTLSDGEDDADERESAMFESRLQQELAMVHVALDGKVDNTKEGRNTFLQQYSHFRLQQEEQLHCLCREKHLLEKDLTRMRKNNEDLSRKLDAVQRELAQLKLDREHQEQVSREEKSALLNRLNAAHNCVSHNMFFKPQELEARLRHFESLYEDIRKENAVLQSELEQRDVDVTQLLVSNSPSSVFDGPVPKPVVQLDTAPSQVGRFKKLELVIEESGPGSNTTQLLLKSVSPSRLHKTLPPKKERNLIMG